MPIPFKIATVTLGSLGRGDPGRVPALEAGSCAMTDRDAYLSRARIQRRSLSPDRSERETRKALELVAIYERAARKAGTDDLFGEAA